MCYLQNPTNLIVHCELETIWKKINYISRLPVEVNFTEMQMFAAIGTTHLSRKMLRASLLGYAYTFAYNNKNWHILQWFLYQILKTVL